VIEVSLVNLMSKSPTINLLRPVANACLVLYEIVMSINKITVFFL